MSISALTLTVLLLGGLAGAIVASRPEPVPAPVPKDDV